MTQTATNLQRNNFNNLSNAIDYALTQRLLNLNTIMVCQFIQYVSTTNATYGEVVQIIDNIDVMGKPLQRPRQFNVPINYIMGGNAGINIQYQAGDLVLVAYSQQTLADIKIAWDNDATINNIQPSSYGKFMLEDGIILGKISPVMPKVVININDTGITVNSNNTPVIINSGSSNTSITAQNVNLTAITKTTVTSPTIELQGNVVITGTLDAQTSITTPSLIINGVDFTLHTHSAGTFNSPSGAVTGNSGGVI